ncbi:hypothetical protein K492DRAFT_236594 [Lichtheimia hyalospora FSU 10163]|nr:hypothetical protein K492DRAFT_236594 [Lichtheimia hyalospora FSU 10163]
MSELPGLANEVVVSDILRVANSLSVYNRKRSEDPVSNTDSKHWCPHHNKCVKDKSEYCNLIKNKNNKPKSKSEPLYGKGLCIYCGDKWNKDHRCEEYRKAKKQKRESEREEKINAIAAASSSVSDSAGTEPATTNHDELESIDMDVLSQPDASIQDEELNEIEDIDMYLPAAVMDLDQEDVIIGADLMPHIGLAITGLAVRWDDKEEKSSDDEMTNSDTPNDAPASSDNERKVFFNGLEKFLEDNANIPFTAFCNIKESLVELPTPEGVTSYHCQYPIPFKLKPVIDAAVEK